MVSIIVPVYNISEYLPACVKSLQDQTCSDIEIVLVDDGSTDGSGALCDRYALEDSRIRVVHKENGGLSAARNAGLDVAIGDWILFVDGDDYLVRDAVEFLRKVAKQQPDADLVQFFYQETEGDWKPETQEIGQTVVTSVPEFFQKLYDLGGVAASACTKLFKKELFKGLRFQEGIRHEDEELMTRLLPQCRKVVYTDLVLYGYVMRQGSIIHSGFSPKAMDIFSIMDERIWVLQRLGCNDLVTETQKRMFQTAVWLYCLARKGGFCNEAKALKSRIIQLSKQKNLPLSGQYRILHRVAAKFHPVVGIYYFTRRITGKT